MKKLIALLAFFSILLTACNGTDNTDKTKEKEISISNNIKIDKELIFVKYKVTVNKAKVYEKKGKLLVDIKLDWTNKVLPDKTSFFVASFLDVKQGDKELVEINDAWNPENKLTSDVFFPNALGGEWSIDLTYELENKDTPIDLTFTPKTETEDSETVTIDLTK
ncbi:hypothetical protein [Lysinibacillus sp. NPDC092081]|uniref:hypothetical protein n=1 Tax=Lysinibacillus sp. NPDC092081 TaxID=3364131 RepID=UPI0037F373C4